MAYLGQQPVVGRYILLDQISGGFNGTASGFTMSTAGGAQGVIPGLAQNVLLSLGGVIQQPGVDYSISGSGLTFTTPPVSGTTFFATVLGDAQSVGTPSDGTVTPASIASGYDFAFPNLNVTGVVTIASGSAASPSLTFTGDLNTGLYSPGADQVAVATNGAQRITVDASGRLLVGTSSARTVDGFAAAIQVEGASAATGAIGAYRTSNDQYGAYLTFGKSRSTFLGGSAVLSNGDEIGVLTFCGADGTDTNSIAARIGAYVEGTPGTNDMPGRLTFSTTSDGAGSPTERMRITADGTLLTFGVANGIVSGHSAAAGTSAQLFLGIHSRTSTTVGGTTSFQVFTNGNVQNTNNSYGAISDIKLKENIVDANSQWDDLKAVQVRKYNFKEETGNPTHTQIGVIAQELELVSPGLVYESPDRETVEIPVLDENGNPVFDENGDPTFTTEERETGEVTKSVNYSVLYMKAVKALQEAMERIETLEGMVAVNNITIDEQQHQLSTLAARLTALESA